MAETRCCATGSTPLAGSVNPKSRGSTNSRPMKTPGIAVNSARTLARFRLVVMGPVSDVKVGNRVDEPGFQLFRLGRAFCFVAFELIEPVEEFSKKDFERFCVDAGRRAH